MSQLTKWRTCCFSPKGKTPIDCSFIKEKTYKYVEPYAKNEKGEFINESPSPILIRDKDFNVYEYIQSFEPSTNLYTLLDRSINDGFVTIQNSKTPMFGDFSSAPKTLVEMRKVLENWDKVQPFIEQLSQKSVENQEQKLETKNDTENKEVNSNV